MSKKSYVFPSLKVANAAKNENIRAADLGSTSRTRKPLSESEEDDEEDTKHTRNVPPSKRTRTVNNADEEHNLRNIKGTRLPNKKEQFSDEDQPEEDEGDDDAMLEAQLEGEDDQALSGDQAKKKRLPELDFVLSFAHRRAHELLRTADEDDDALLSVLATWLKEIQDRFETFEKQAAKFDEYESALLQSQRMHQKYRKIIGDLLRQERKIKRELSKTMVQNELRQKGKRESAKEHALFQALSRTSS